MKKRIDIIIDEFNKRRGYVINDHGKIIIEFNQELFHAHKQLKETTNYKEIVISDPLFINLLKEEGYDVRGVIKNRDSLHVTIKHEYIRMLKIEAAKKDVSISRLVEQVIAEYYKNEKE